VTVGVGTSCVGVSTTLVICAAAVGEAFASLWPQADKKMPRHTSKNICFFMMVVPPNFWDELVAEF
jgi:hypothetical protein